MTLFFKRTEVGKQNQNKSIDIDNEQELKPNHKDRTERQENCKGTHRVLFFRDIRC